MRRLASRLLRSPRSESALWRRLAHAGYAERERHEAGIDASVFDLDGTLWDAAAASAEGWNLALAEAGRHSLG